MNEQILEQLFNQAYQALQAGQIDAAKNLGREMEKLAPRDQRTLSILAHGFRASGEANEAAQYFALLHDLDPENLSHRQHLAEVFCELGFIEEAIEIYRPVFESLPDTVEKFTYFGQMCQHGRAEKEAVQHFKRASEIDPENPDIHNAIAGILLMDGDVDGGAEELRKALQLYPAHLGSLITKAEFLNLKDQERRTLQGVVDAEAEHLGTRVDAAFSLAKAIMREEDNDAAFKAFARANELLNRLFIEKGRKYNPEEEEKNFKEYSETFSAGLMSRLPTYHPGPFAPVFIIGLPRSGTTLVEHVLGAHPEIEAAGEVKVLGQFAGRIKMLQEKLKGQSAEEIFLLNARLYRQENFNKLKEFTSGNSKFVTDKMPSNFAHVGLARALYPEAKFIFIRRNPLDNCLSMFFQPLNEGYPATASLENLGHYYNLFIRYLEAWKGLPDLNFHELDYQEFTENPEAEIKKLIEFLGVPWDENCLDFHRQKGAVRTFSSLQVREPVSKKYVGRWKKYEKHLGPLKKALGEA